MTKHLGPTGLELRSRTRGSLRPRRDDTETDLTQPRDGSLDGLVIVALIFGDQPERYPRGDRLLRICNLDAEKLGASALTPAVAPRVSASLRALAKQPLNPL
jgi:hypothetical protein